MRYSPRPSSALGKSKVSLSAAATMQHYTDLQCIGTYSAVSAQNRRPSTVANELNRGRAFSSCCHGCCAGSSPHSLATASLLPLFSLELSSDAGRMHLPGGAPPKRWQLAGPRSLATGLRDELQPCDQATVPPHHTSTTPFCQIPSGKQHQSSSRTAFHCCDNYELNPQIRHTFAKGPSKWRSTNTTTTRSSL